MSIEVAPAEEFESCFDSGISGQVGTASWMLIDNDGGVWFSASTDDIVESPAASGIYCAQRTAPIAAGHYTIVWSVDGTYDPATVGIEDLLVEIASVTPTPLPPLIGSGSGGPCRAWTTEEEVADCCGITDTADIAELTTPVVAASQLLYVLGGRQHPGTCERLVRPCAKAYGCPPSPWDGYSRGCGCSGLDRVPLAGRAQEILEVRIDGDVVDPDTYRLDESRWLTRVPAPSDLTTRLYWPSCQDMELDELQEGTFSILYTYGVDPPVPAQLAAKELACALWETQCAGGATSEECRLPNGVTKVEREGITIELNAFRAWGRDENGRWNTGMPLVDAFLNAYNPEGLRRGMRVWSPDYPNYPRPSVQTGS